MAALDLFESRLREESMRKRLRIGSGAGYAGDRIDPAVVLAEEGNIQYLCFECLAERTIAIAQMEKQADPGRGYGQFLEERMEAVLPRCARDGLVVVSNLGAANPPAALEKTFEIARSLGIGGVRIGAVTGDDVLEAVRSENTVVVETGGFVRDLGDRLISANAYLGADALLPALQAGCRVILAGRVADPSLFLAPMIHEHRWDLEDWHRLGAGTALGHLLECAAQVTGGYFADPGVKDVRDLENVGFPIAEIDDDGTGILTKVPGTGGAVNLGTCREQILYEVHDPASYLTPDVTADFSAIMLKDLGQDRVRITGATGRPRPETLKVSLGVRQGYLGEGEISYAGRGALARARLAGEIVSKRLERRGFRRSEVRVEYIGYNALLGFLAEASFSAPGDVRLRVAARAEKKREAERVGEEVENLYLNGPAGPGGARKTARPLIGIYSAHVPRDRVKPRLMIRDVP